MPPIDLDIDVLGRVFALVDVYTILSLSRVNRLFREITLTKQVWLSVVRDLAARQLIAAPSVDIDQLSKDALINEVKRAVAGPRTWSPESSLTPKLLRRLTFPLDSSQFVKLLPGNSYMLCHRLVSIPGFRDFRAIECFETKSGRLAWTWSRAGFNVLTVTFDFLAGTSEAVVALTVSIPT
ncbi:hypothetical protein B0H19DRAFT_577749 [Mycena capillaripes]|nr:hypothetical protein B0H19DRAFT_577749 [Mycena capillaripes]